MTNKERQKSLDKQKWLESEISSIDKSGIMVYCGVCEYKTSNFTCTATQKQRQENCLCAKAFNKMQRKCQKTVDKQ